MKKKWEIKTLEKLGADIPYPIGDGDHGQTSSDASRQEGA